MPHQGSGLYLTPVIDSFLIRTRDRFTAVTEDPFVMIRVVLGGIFGLAAVVALFLSWTGIAPQAWLLAGAAWALYSFAGGILELVAEPATDFLANGAGSIGLVRAGKGGRGFSEIEALEAQGHLEAAADAYLLRAEAPADRFSALLRRAALLAGPLGSPEAAVKELYTLRSSFTDLQAPEDIMIGMMLVEIHDQQLHQPGRAMVELRRLIDRYPGRRQTEGFRSLLAGLRRRHFHANPVSENPR